MGLFDFFKKKKPSIPPEALCVWVHRRRHLEQLHRLMKQRGESGFAVLRPLSEVFSISVALSTSDGAMPVTLDHLEQLDLSPEEALQRACVNAHPALQTIGRAGDVFAWEGNFAPAALAMMSAIRPHLPVKGAPVMMIPAEGLVLVAGADDEQALSQMLTLAEKSYGSSEDFVSLRPVTWGSEVLPVEWSPPADHPLRDRFAAAAARTHRHEAQGEHHVYAAESAPLAHLAALPPEKGGQLIASWMRDANVVIPSSVARVVLIDTDDEPLPRLEVALSTLLETFPEAFEPLRCGEAESEDVELADARLVRTRGVLFPTLSEKRYLVARQALLDAKVPATEREVPAAELLAAWDAGDAIITRHELAAMRLCAPDGRTAEVTPEVFGERWKRRGAADQQRFEQALAVNLVLGAMLDAAAAAENGELPEPGEPPAEQDEASDAPSPTASTRPALLSSNDLNGVREAKGEDEEESEAGKALMLQMLSAGEPSRLFPIVRPPRFDEAQRQNEVGMVQGFTGEQAMEVISPERLTRPGPEGLTYELVSDAGNRVMPLNGMLFGGELLEPAWRTALLNVKAASIDPPHRRGDGWYEGPWHDDFDASRLLLVPSIARACKVKGQTLIFAPTVGRTWVVGSDDLEGMTAVLAAAEEHLASEETVSPYQFRQLLFGWPWLAHADRVERWAIPAGHPLAERIAKLDAALQKRREASMQHVGGFARASYSPLQPRSSSDA